jgi:tetratricopeptide (TPR) repeat protein
MPYVIVAVAAAVMLAVDGCGEGENGGGKGPVDPAHPQGKSKAHSAMKLALHAADANFVDDASCYACHADQHKQWLGSHHQMAMQPPSDETVRGDFNNTEFTRFGVKSKFFRKGSEYWVNTDGPDGKLADFRVKYTFGVDPIQQYLMEHTDGRLQCLTIAWDTKNKKWFDLQPEIKVESDDRFHWMRGAYNWNRTCAHCHSTALRKKFNLKTKTYHTTYKDVTVSCQACHGPGKQHLAWVANKNAGKPVDKGFGLAVNVKGPAREQVDACARCHIRSQQALSFGYKHGDPLQDHFRPALLADQLYHADGQINDEVYVYGSYVQSKMYHAGVRCTDCHNPHTAKTHVPSNALCVRCHQPAPPVQQFKTLKPKAYDTPEHHHHKPGSPGARCVSCHMPSKTYMLLDPRRDHSLRIPRPDLSLMIGTPNACSGCHQKTNKKQDAKWAADAFEKWWGGKKRPPHYGQIIAAARTGNLAVEPALMGLAMDSKQPGIVRATALSLIQGFDQGSVVKVFGQAMKDPEPLVRYAGVSGYSRLTFLQPAARLAALFPMLSDASRNVRFEAARMLASRPTMDLMNTAQAEAMNKVLPELKRVLIADSDNPGSMIQLGEILENQYDYDRAIEHYSAAARVDDQYFFRYMARLRLARVYYKQAAKASDPGEGADWRDKMRRQLRSIMAKDKPRGVQDLDWARIRAEAVFMRGQLIAEDKTKIAEAGRMFALAARITPRNARAHYQHGLAMELQKKHDEAVAPYEKALALAPAHLDYLLGLVRVHIYRGKPTDGIPYMERARQISPKDPRVRQRMQQLRGALQGQPPR